MQPTPTPTPQPALYTRLDIAERGGPRKTHLYNLIARGQFPDATVRIGARYTRWSAAEVDKWLDDPSAWIAANAPASVAEAA